ncbi:MAG: ATP-binding protein [Candidatus Thiodiazotropha taylori]|nr:ATP-binding protein [Candidatus Thiodiazotropha taylori]MCW4226665.1 ATP-binding protein [Candidatus Thiodiazotropha endolucinida]MCG7888227.1 ATP-binding protein [Candidatus Thiodiazotropha taylori]MCG7953103.1 ATP-binding protein [Candidatus Thiodiazotropha taylori]MCG8032954.1 ATP-binding protein [Candidatus Thiodiazotropha taylori]
MRDGEVVSSPAATGDAGGHFEQHVDAFSLALLLVGATPPILTNTSVAEVCFQTEHLGWKTDDLLIVGETGADVLRKLAVQVKRSFTVSASNADCRKTIEGFWDDFQANDRFNVSEDRLAVITQHGTSTLLHSFNSLLECARASVDTDDFHHRVGLEGYISKKAKQQNEVIKSILTDYIGTPPGDDDYWRFLRVVNILSYDLNTSTAQTEALALSLLAHVSAGVPDAVSAAKATWAALLECAGRGRPTASIYRRESLPADIVALHTTIPISDTNDLRALIEHGMTVRESIRSTIGSDYEINRSAELGALLAELDEHQVVIVTGAAGSGKSALAKKLLTQVEANRPILAFQAVEFATPHINETLANTQTTINEQRLLAILAGHDRVVVLVESVERLLEHSVRDAFSHLLQAVQHDRAIQLVLTCRDYSVETVRNSLLAPLGLLHSVHEVPPLSDGDLQLVQEAVTSLDLPLRDSQLRAFLRTPYVLDMASRLEWEEGAHLENARAFREKCWKELIRAEHFTAAGMPRRREAAFIDVAHRRATELRPFVRPDSPDAEALDALVQASLIACAPQSSAFFAPAHDVLEDWAIIRWLDEQFSSTEDPIIVLADCVGGYPALRRGFRRWLGERFEISTDTARNFVLGALDQPELPSYFRDDCLVAALLSDSASDFLAGCMDRIERGDTQLLSQIIHVLRVACKSSPRWLSIPGLPSQMLVPEGPGWVPVLQVVSRLIHNLLPTNALLIMGLVEDWAKQIDWNNAFPAGSKEAGLIVEALLPCFDGYRFDDARKRTIEVLLKIPRAVPGFNGLIARAETCDRRDYAASDLADLILGSVSGAYACRDFPAEVISLVNVRLRLTDADFEHEYHLSALEVSQVFGIREHGVSEFFPASALQGPFGALLRSHPREGLDFILDLLNHAGEWYGTQRWPGGSLEPAWQITLDIPDSGPVQQWMNGRLYGMYRGMTVGPDVLQSALMALEAWLLGAAEMEGVNLETWLLYILRTSNNVMATAVVASICIAYPDKAGRAGLALLTNRELIDCDRSRVVSESTAGLEMFSGMNPSHLIYEQERKQSNSRKHRREDLESLAVRMQLTDLREDVWQIIDRHRSELPDDQDEGTLVWRLALHRMDVRGYRPVDAPESASEESTEDVGNRVYLGPGEIEPDVQRIVDENSESQAITNRHLGLVNRARNAWQDRSSKESAEWKALLGEAQAIERELGEPEDYCRGGAGIVAAVCVRDHVDELNNEELNWCARRIELEVRQNATDPDDTTRVGRGGILWPDRACASVVPLLAVHERCDAQALLALALTHPVDEVVTYAHAGVGAFLKDPYKELVLQCAAAAAYRGRLIAAVRDEEAALPYYEQTRGRDLMDRVVPAVREAIEGAVLDIPNELASLDFDDWTSATAIRMILEMFGHHPDWEEARQFFSRVTEWLAIVWDRDRRHSRDEGRRNYELEHEALRAVARFLLKLPIEEAQRICQPLIDGVDLNTRKAADFLQDLIVAADGGADDCFWDLWQAIADKAVNAPWVGRLDSERPYEESFINRVFLGTYWKDDVKHWERLEGHAHRLDTLATRLPAVTTCLEAYSRFLYTIGQQSLPDAFKVVAALFEKGDTVRMASSSEIAFHLESLLRRFVYSEPHRLKSDTTLRDAVLVILDALISAGSSSAYRMRDDFVTPLG